MIRKTLTIALIAFLPLFLPGQVTSRSACDSLYNAITGPKLKGDLLFTPFQSVGSPYFRDEWMEGTIFLSNNLAVKEKHLRYNGYIDRLIRVTTNLRQVKLDKESVTGFILHDSVSGISYSFEKINIREELISEPVEVYAQLLCKGKLSLYAYRQVRKSGSEQEPGNRYVIYKFERRDSYYFSDNGHILPGFRSITRRNVLKNFPGRKEQIITHLKAGNLSRIRTEKELIRFTEIVNSTN